MRNIKKRFIVLVAVVGLAVPLALVMLGDQASAHKAPHDAETMKAFQDEFMNWVILGDKLYHGDPAAAKEMGVTLSKTGMACAMCHPIGSDIHPHEFPKFQEQMSEFATLREMTNWCIEKPNEGEKIDPNGDAMKALEAYMYWSAKGSMLDPGRH